MEGWERLFFITLLAIGQVLMIWQIVMTNAVSLRSLKLTFIDWGFMSSNILFKYQHVYVFKYHKGSDYNTDELFPNPRTPSNVFSVKYLYKHSNSFSTRVYIHIQVG